MEAAPKKLAILGSTGVIGRYALEIAEKFPERFSVVGLAAGSNAKLLFEQAARFKPRLASLSNGQGGASAPDLGPTRLLSGPEGLVEVAAMEEADLVVSAVVGFAGLAPTLAALAAGKQVALANKECLVAGGALVMAAARRAGTEILPIDSEISAIFQSLAGHNRSELRRIILTASGGPFRGKSLEELKSVTAAQALAHPNWDMGPKITIDSATLMNKGLEAIEASWLFGLSPERISIHIHPTSIVHSAVEYVDGSVVAQLAVPDMRLPIAYALAYPNRLALDDPPPLDLFSARPLVFEEPDLIRFPCLALALEAGRIGGSAPVVLGAADEVAVEAFLNDRIGFMDIPRVVEKTLETRPEAKPSDLRTILAIDAEARAKAAQIVYDI